MHVEPLLGDEGREILRSSVGRGIYPHNPSTDPEAENYREFMVFFRRLQVPYFEEARRYFSEAIAGGMLESPDSDSVDDPDFLKEVIERYWK